MRITSFRIQGFKSIKDLIVTDLGDINVFYGLNDVGKSNIFQALDFWHHVINKKGNIGKFGTPLFYLGGKEEIKIEVEMSLGDAELERLSLYHNLEMFLQNSLLQQEFKDELDKQLEDKKVISKVSFSKKTTNSQLFFKHIPQMGDFSEKDDPILPHFHIIQATRRLHLEKWGKKNGTQIITANNLKQALFFAYLSREREQKQKLEAVKKVLQNDPYNLGELDVALNQETNEIDIGFIRNGERLPIESLGSGSQQLLLMLGQIFLNDYPTVVLEEPEMNLSPLYQERLLDTLDELMQDTATQLNQLFISTNSSHLEFQKNFYEVTFDEENGTQVSKATEKQHKSYFSITEKGPDTRGRLNSYNQVKLYDGMIKDLGLERGDMVVFVKNEADRWEIRSAEDVATEIQQTIHSEPE